MQIFIHFSAKGNRFFMKIFILFIKLYFWGVNMYGKYFPKLVIFAVICLLIFPMLSQNTRAIESNFKNKKTINIAVIWQKWDVLDIASKPAMFFYKSHLRKAESRYNVNFKIYEFWDDKNGGDIQNGRLEELDIDLIIGPGGFGTWNTPKEYRDKIKEFISQGGGFYGICGDSTFGTLGVINLPKFYRLLLFRNAGFFDITPMLGVANVYTDASDLSKALDQPLLFNKLDLMKTMFDLMISRGSIYIYDSKIPIQKPYFKQKIKVMMGNAGLVDGPIINRLFMSKVNTIASFVDADEPYGESIIDKKAIIATTYKKGRVVLSAPHPEFTIGNSKAYDIFIRNILWCVDELPESKFFNQGLNNN